jgi:hypothetical protein
MIDEYMDEQDQQPVDPFQHFEGLFNTPQGQAFAEEARVRLNDYITTRQIAEANLAAGEAFASNLGEMRANFLGMVQDDPTAIDVALDLARLGVSAMVGTVPGVDPEHVENIATGIQRDIARTAVGTLAERHEGLARQMLENPRIRELLGDEKEPLAGYITAQSVARRIDAENEQRQAQRTAVEQANQTAWSYMAAMVDPETGDLGYVPGWAKQVMADPRMPPEYKAGLFDVFGRLTENGDAPESDPLALDQLVRAAASGNISPMAALTRAGDDIKAADAVYLAKLASDPEQRSRAAALANVLDIGKQALAMPENGPAGIRAFGDFTNWALSQARSGADLDPASKTYILAGNRLQQFAPRASSIVDSTIQIEPQERRSLADIFGGISARTSK